MENTIVYNGVQISTHALDRFIERADRLGIDASWDALNQALLTAKPELQQKQHLSRATREHLFRREMLHKDKGRVSFTSGGWRFIKKESCVVTVERIKSHENFHAVPTQESRNQARSERRFANCK